jgi:hypothetical protein
MAEHKLYGLARKEGSEVIYALQPRRADVWHVACDFMFGPGMWNQETQEKLYKVGWRVVPVTLTVEQKPVKSRK